MEDGPAYAPGATVAKRSTMVDGRSPIDDRVLAELASVRTEVIALRNEVSVLRKEMVIVRQAVGVLLTRRG